MSAFEKWFVAQHGARPGPGLEQDSLFERVKLGHEARGILDARQDWDNRRQSALYAWQARERVDLQHNE